MLSSTLYIREEEIEGGGGRERDRTDLPSVFLKEGGEGEGERKEEEEEREEGH
jgi:hypothetical protein